MSDETPEWLTWTSDGNASVSLVVGLTVSGQPTQTVVMRCPSLLDIEAMEARGEGAGLQAEKQTVAAWCGMTEQELTAIKWPDYRRLQTAFVAMAGGEPGKWAPTRAGA